MRSFIALCPECKRGQVARFVQTAQEKYLSEHQFWSTLNSRKKIEVIHSLIEGDKHDHIWTLDEQGRENALVYTKPRSDK